ncbi:MAG: GTPase [Microthrixaceae bacterium]
MALVGRPNVGKSTLFNRLIGSERSVVHDMAGTTRDSIDTVVDTEAGRIRFVDTAGMRRKARIDEDTEYFSMLRALRSVDDADVALLVIDSTEGHPPGPAPRRTRRRGRLSGGGAAQQVGAPRRRGPRLGGHPGGATAALPGRTLRAEDLRTHGEGVQKLLPALAGSIEAYGTRIPTREVNDVLRRAQQAQPAPHGARVLYATQGATDPPTFTLFTNRELPASYLRYLERSIREAFELGATPIKLRVRRRS